MSRKAPFTAYLSVVPTRGKRFETIRSLQRLAALIYDGIDGTSGLRGNSNIAIARPGGGQASGYNGSDMTNYQDGCAIIPQFGESPARLMITGFYLPSNTNNDQPWADKTVIHANEYFTGADGNNAVKINPATAVENEVAALKAIIDNVISTEVPGENVLLFRLDYMGITWGDRGFHFPL